MYQNSYFTNFNIKSAYQTYYFPEGVTSAVTSLHFSTSNLKNCDSRTDAAACTNGAMTCLTSHECVINCYGAENCQFMNIQKSLAWLPRHLKKAFKMRGENVVFFDWKKYILLVNLMLSFEKMKKPPAKSVFFPLIHDKKSKNLQKIRNVSIFQSNKYDIFPPY